MMVRQLEEELRMRMRGPSVEMQQQMEVLYNENEHLTREIAILRDTIKVRSLLFVSLVRFVRFQRCRLEARRFDGSHCDLSSDNRTLPRRRRFDLEVKISRVVILSKTQDL